MKITKIGHCCLLIETKGKRIMTDPGSFTIDDHVLENIDIVIFTHEHADHIHIDSLKEILKQNPDAAVVANGSVGKLLDEADISYQKLEGTETAEICGVTIQACDAKHAEIFEEFGQVQNTGYSIDERLFYPGDAYAEFEKDVDILAMPAGGPWCRITDALHYTLKINPKHAFPVHDGIEREDKVHIIHGVAQKVLEQHNINFVSMKSGDSHEF